MINGPVLLTGPDPVVESFFKKTPPWAVQGGVQYVSRTLGLDVLDEIAREEFAGVVCQAEGDEAVDLVDQIHCRNPRTPILVISARADSEYESRLTGTGAAAVVQGTFHDAVVAENATRKMLLLVEQRRLAESLRLSGEIRDQMTAAAFQKRATANAAREQRRLFEQRGLLPLLIEDKVEEAFRMVRAFEAASVHAPLPILKSVEVALAYLRREPPFENALVPNSIFFGLSPTEPGVELARWIRSRPEFSTVPFIVLSMDGDGSAIPPAYGGLANSFLMKPAGFEELVTMVRSVNHYWTRVNIGRDF